MRRVLAAAAAILGILSLFAGKTSDRSAGGSSAAGATLPSIAPVELAEWIRDRKPHLRIVDVRSEAAFDEYHLPRAERLTSSTTFAPDDTVVLVAGGSVRARNVYMLRGGVQAWIDEVMNLTITVDAPPSAHIAFQRASIVSRYFGGVPRVVDKLPAVRTNAAAVRRRGC